MSFLSAEWRKLAIANYAIDPQVLADYVPFGTELDLWQGTCYVSLVGFRFVNTRLLGIKVPFHVNFEEVNLRFYVKRLEAGTWKRGVVFVKEIVPKHALTLVANILYKEHYETMPMRHRWAENGEQRTVAYEWKKKGRWHRFRVEAARETSAILPGSETEFITEHYWGYARVNENTTNEYEVTHPSWEAYEILAHELSLDFGAVYGQEFGFLTNQAPTSIMLAEGSAITVESSRKIRRPS